MKEQSTCPLCASKALLIALSRHFYKCTTCKLVHKGRNEWPTPKEEADHYAKHQNDPDDPRYRQFLDRFLIPLEERISPECRLLDFGCGPTKALETIFGKKGYGYVSSYDPVFFPNNPLPHVKAYEAIVLSEVLEHMHHPGKIFPLLIHNLKRHGILCIMTSTYDDLSNFNTWYYALDPTHVCFYSRHTFSFICEMFSLRMLCPSDNVFLLQLNEPIG